MIAGAGLIRVEHWKRLALAAIAMALLATFFWTTSRYPSLDEKAMMSGAIQLEDPLGFEALIALDPEAGTLERIGVSTVNWINTNKKGMTFGWLFGAAFLTVLGYFRRRNFRGSFANSAYGLVIGAPLGVCVNCAAPIARGLFQGGSRAETTLSAMIASPTLNVVVLTMAFSLLPFYIAATKVALSLFVILIGVPLICRFLPKERLQRAAPSSGTVPEAPELSEPATESLTRSLYGFVADFLRNFWFILRATAPLMLLAGFLGAIAGTLLPADLISGREFGPLSALAAGLVGTFLPVPIGFDVVVSGALLNGGVGHGFVMTLVFTLGSFSVYSFMIVATSIGWRAAGLLAVMVAGLGIVSGFAVEAYHDYQARRAIELLTADAPRAGLALAPAAGGLGTGLTLQAVESAGSDSALRGVTVDRQPYAEREQGAMPFTRIEAWHIGIEQPIEFSFSDMWPPFWEGRSVASGDLDGDGDMDLIIASTRVGLYVYLNDGSGRFEGGAIDDPRLASLPIFNAAIVDIDNDGWRDVFLTTYQEGNYVLPNRGGTLDVDGLRHVANRSDAILTLAASFGDVDADGYLDVALGNWAAGWYRRIPGEESRNRIVLNDGGALTGDRYIDLPGIPGETLSILLSDLDADGDQDLVVGNDFEVPDYIYFGDGAGAMAPVTRQDDRIPMTTNTTMSVSAFDARNDGQMALYFAQIAGRAEGVSDRLRMRPIRRYCDGIERESDRAICQQNMSIKTWYRPGNSLDPSNASRCATFDEPYRSECRGMMIKDLAIQNNSRDMCALIPVSQPRIRAYCDIHFQPGRAMTQAEQSAALPQIMSRNVLLEPGAEGRYTETAQTSGLEVGGWSWDVSVGDLDNNGWQDIYIVNGTWVPNEVSPTNIMLSNVGAAAFDEVTEPWGLTDFAITAAATLFDLDRDGDLDIITVPVNAPVTAFINNAGDNSITVRLDDRIGNRDGIGARIELFDESFPTGLQTRDVQLGGGFMSFDAPIAHFGLGGAESIDRMRIRWPDGMVSEIEGPLTASATYVVSRAAEEVSAQ